jgi:hypothetical protein
MICRRYSFQKLTQFICGNNVLDAAASITNGFLSRYTCVSSIQMKSLFGTKRAYLQIEKHHLQEVFPSNTDSMLTGK